MSLVLLAADGDSQPVSMPSFAAALDAHGALSFRGAHRIEGCYVLEGHRDEVAELLSDDAMSYVAEMKHGGRAYNGSLKILEIRFPAID